MGVLLTHLTGGGVPAGVVQPCQARMGQQLQREVGVARALLLGLRPARGHMEQQGRKGGSRGSGRGVPGVRKGTATRGVPNAGCPTTAGAAAAVRTSPATRRPLPGDQSCPSGT